MFNPANYSDTELDNKIQELNRKIALTTNLEIYNQILMYLDQLYYEFDERQMKQFLDSTEGLAVDTEADYEERTKGPSKDSKKVKEKAKSFMENSPEIKIKWNKDNPRATDSEQS